MNDEFLCSKIINISNNLLIWFIRSHWDVGMTWNNNKQGWDAITPPLLHIQSTATQAAESLFSFYILLTIV